MPAQRWSRRELFRKSGQVAVVTVGAGALAPLPATAAENARPGAAPGAAAPPNSVRIHEGTNLAAAVSPDGKHLAFDLLTAIWVAPVAGGTARRLTDDLQDATQPSWAPDGSRVAFQSYRDGNYHVYTARPDGAGLRKHTGGRFDHREPKFSPDGKQLVFSSDRSGGSYGIWLLNVATGTLTQLTDTPDEEAAPVFSPDGKRVAFTVNETAIDVLTIATGRRRTVHGKKQAAEGETLPKLFGPAFSPDGALSYLRLRGAAADLMLGERALTSDEDVFGFAASWSGNQLTYTADGRIRRMRVQGGRPGRVTEIPFSAVVSYTPHEDRNPVRDIDSRRPTKARGIASPVVSPDRKQLAFRALGAIYLAPVGGGKARKLISDGYFNSDPDFSPDGKSLVYASDRSGTADLWLRNLRTGKERVISTLEGAQITPRFSPDGRKIAYTNEDGAVWTIEVATGAVQQLTPELFMPGRPTWSADSRTVALGAVKPFSARFREGTSQILTIDLAAETLTYTEPMPFQSLSTRGDDGPVWSPDGRHMAFVVSSVAWVVRVNAKGKFTGKPVQVTTEATDSLAWIGNDTLLYLNEGRVRRVGIDGAAPRTIPVELTWRRPAAPKKTVIHAGSVWDGRAERLRHNMDIVVSGGRIEEIRPHRRGSTVDASELTVMPGLIDSHNHWHLRGRQWGERQGRLWLSYGITTTRSPGDPVYQMLETREALESGAQLGPRYFGTGEAIDGGRVYYNFMRPTLSVAQLQREMSRALSLDYDLIKTYVRLPVALQRAAIRIAHRAGVPLSSHYLYPATRIGMDGMEHTGATNRLGYSHTVSRLGRAYQDAITLFTASGMSITPTLFNSSALYAEDTSLVQDERTRVLFPPWEYEALQETAEGAKGPQGAVARATLRGNVDMIRKIHRGGGLVINGTDAPLDNVAISTHQNLRAMVEFGFTPYEALQTATKNPARWLGFPETLGVIKPGARADLSFVTGNPLADIRHAAAVRQVMRGGHLYTVDELLEPFRQPESTQRGGNQVLAAAASARHDHAHWWHEPERKNRVCCGP